MTSPTQALVERLTALGQTCWSVCNDEESLAWQSNAELCEEAVTALSGLASEIATLQRKIRVRELHIQQLIDERAALAAAPVPPAAEPQVNLHDTFDAAIWAREFVRFNPALDESAMLGWFANAIMAGYDHAKRLRISWTWPSTLHELPVPALSEQARTIGNAPICPHCSREVVTILDGCCTHCGTRFVQSLPSEDT